MNKLYSILCVVALLGGCWASKNLGPDPNETSLRGPASLITENLSIRGFIDSSYSSGHAPSRNIPSFFLHELHSEAPPAPAGVPRDFVAGEAPSTEEYDRIYENPFREAKGNPLSTFSIDVDTASYANSRRFLRNGRLPPKDAVRIEEFINYFNYDYPSPTGEDPFSVNCVLGPCPWNEKHELLLVGLQGKEIDAAQLPPSNLVFLADVSGSMSYHDKLPLLKKSLRMLVEEMRPEDRVALVVYAGAAGLVLDSTSGKEKKKIEQWKPGSQKYIYKETMLKKTKSKNY